MEGPVLSTITLNSSGTGTAVVTYSTTFANAPLLLPILPEGATSDSWVVSLETSTGFTMTVTAEATPFQSKTIEWGYFAHSRI